MDQFNEEHLDLPPPDAGRKVESRAGRLQRLVRRALTGSRIDEDAEAQASYERAEAQFEVEIAAATLQRLIVSTVPYDDGYHLDWLIEGESPAIDAHRLAVVVPVWRAGNTEQLAQRLNYLSWLREHEDTVTLKDLNDFVIYAGESSASLLSSLRL